MTDIPTINRDDVPPYFLHLVREVFHHINYLQASFERRVPEGYLDPDSHERNAFTLKELKRLNDEIYNLGRVDARAPTHRLGISCSPMRGEKAAIERLRRFSRGNSQSAGLLRFLTPATESGEAE